MEFKTRKQLLSYILNSDMFYPNSEEAMMLAVPSKIGEDLFGECIRNWMRFQPVAKDEELRLIMQIILHTDYPDLTLSPLGEGAYEGNATKVLVKDLPEVRDNHRLQKFINKVNSDKE